MPNRSSVEKCKSGDGEFSLYDTGPADLPVLLDVIKSDSIRSRILITSGPAMKKMPRLLREWEGQGI